MTIKSRTTKRQRINRERCRRLWKDCPRTDNRRIDLAFMAQKVALGISWEPPVPHWVRVQPWNHRDSVRFLQLNRANLNQPLSKLVCPNCEGRSIRRDGNEHPGCFECPECGEAILA